jgi:hypothetical protein
MLLVGGCVHPLVIKNMSNYQTFGITTFEKPLKIGIVTDTTEPEQKSLLNGVANALGNYSAQVVMPYAPNSQKPIDVIAHIDIETAHEGSGWNFLINFPGFLIFTPAWNGYVYEVRYMINCTLVKEANNKVIDQFKIPIMLDIRHASYDRTWTEISWFEVGAIAFVGGLVFITYDNNVTPLVMEKTESPLGKYIAQEIVKRINSKGEFTNIRLPAPEPTEKTVDQQNKYPKIKGIILNNENGKTVYGEILNMNDEKIEIKTKDGKIETYRFDDVYRFININE